MIYKRLQIKCHINNDHKNADFMRKPYNFVRILLIKSATFYETSAGSPRSSSCTKFYLQWSLQYCSWSLFLLFVTVLAFRFCISSLLLYLPFVTVLLFVTVFTLCYCIYSSLLYLFFVTVFILRYCNNSFSPSVMDVAFLKSIRKYSVPLVFTI